MRISVSLHRCHRCGIVVAEPGSIDQITPFAVLCDQCYEHICAAGEPNPYPLYKPLVCLTAHET